MLTEQQAHDLLEELLEESGYQATPETEELVAWVIPLSNAESFPAEPSPEIAAILARVHQLHVKEALELVDVLAGELSYSFNLGCVLVEASTRERLALREILARAKASRTVAQEA